MDFAKHRFETEAVTADVRLGPDLRIDRDQEALAIGLNAKATEEDECNTAGLDLAVKPLQRFAHAVTGQIFTDLDRKAVALELLGNAAGVVDGLLQWRVRVGISRIADHEGESVRGGRWRRKNRCNRKHQNSQQRKAYTHSASFLP